jgi:hypothetical protein
MGNPDWLAGLDGDGLEKLGQRFVKAVSSVIGKFGGTPDNARDLAQETFATLHARIICRKIEPPRDEEDLTNMLWEVFRDNIRPKWLSRLSLHRHTFTTKKAHTEVLSFSGGEQEVLVREETEVRHVSLDGNGLQPRDQPRLTAADTESVLSDNADLGERAVRAALTEVVIDKCLKFFREEHDEDAVEYLEAVRRGEAVTPRDFRDWEKKRVNNTRKRILRYLAKVHKSLQERPNSMADEVCGVAIGWLRQSADGTPAPQEADVRRILDRLVRPNETATTTPPLRG